MNEKVFLGGPILYYLVHWDLEIFELTASLLFSMMLWHFGYIYLSVFRRDFLQSLH